MKFRKTTYFCEVCGKPKVKLGVAGLVSHPACLKKLQKMHAGKYEMKQTTTRRMKNRTVEYFAKTGV